MMSKQRRTITTIVIAIALLAWLIRGIIRIARPKDNGHQTEMQSSDGSFYAQTNQGNPEVNIALGLPTDNDASNDYILKRAQYVLSYNHQTHNPNWLSYNLSAWWYGEAKRHKGEFLPDPDLPSEYRPTLHRDYINSGFDRGHMVRSEERTRNDDDNLSTFYTTNIIPQYHELNAGPWLQLEDYCEFLCKRQGKELWVMDGPVYDYDMGTIGRDVRVPSSCFKIVVVLNKGQSLANINKQTPVIAVLMPNKREVEHTDWMSYLTSVREIETHTQYNFLSNVSIEIQDAIENFILSSKSELSTQ